MFRPLALATALTAAVLLDAPAQATTILYNDFSSTAGLALNGSASPVTDGSGRAVLRLTPATVSQAGSAFSTSPVTLNASASFSSAFGFNINQANGVGGGADGLVFVVQTVSNNVGSNGGGIGYSGITNSVGIKFDTFQNTGDPNNNFVGVVLGGDIVAVTTANSPFNLKGGQDLFGFVDYNGATNDLQVRLSNTATRPDAALIDYSVNLATELGSPNAFVGFTSATGAGYENHDILNFQFRDTFSPIVTQTELPTAVPEPASLALLGLGLAGLGLVRRKD